MVPGPQAMQGAGEMSVRSSGRKSPCNRESARDSMPLVVAMMCVPCSAPSSFGCRLWPAASTVSCCCVSLEVELPSILSPSEKSVVRLELRMAGDGTADAAMVRMQQENVQLRTTAERVAAELRHLRDKRRTDPDRALHRHCVRLVSNGRVLLISVWGGKSLTLGGVCVLDAAAMARRVSAAEQAAQHAVAEASAMRSALLEAEAANAYLHAQLRAWPPAHNAAQALTRQALRFSRQSALLLLVEVPVQLSSAAT